VDVLHDLVDRRLALDGRIDAGEIMGIPACWQIGAASNEREEATSPKSATMWSLEIIFRTTVAASPGRL
jgi:hypothetical protein